jgi:hypothetical protein
MTPKVRPKRDIVLRRKLMSDEGLRISNVVVGMDVCLHVALVRMKAKA